MLITTNQDLRIGKKPSVRVDSMKSGSARAVVESLAFYNGWYYGIMLLCLPLSALFLP